MELPNNNGIVHISYFGMENACRKVVLLKGFVSVLTYIIIYLEESGDGILTHEKHTCRHPYIQSYS